MLKYGWNACNKQSVSHLNTVAMTGLKLKQLQYESDTWKRLLGFLTDENINLKNRLSEILRDDFESSLLDVLEIFQNRFINEDNMIGLLRNEITEYDRVLIRENFEDGHLKNEVVTLLNKLRNNMKYAEIESGKLRRDFNSYITENIYKMEVSTPGY